MIDMVYLQIHLTFGPYWLQIGSRFGIDEKKRHIVLKNEVEHATQERYAHSMGVNQCKHQQIKKLSITFY